MARRKNKFRGLIAGHTVENLDRAECRDALSIDDSRDIVREIQAATVAASSVLRRTVHLHEIALVPAMQ